MKYRESISSEKTPILFSESRYIIGLTRRIKSEKLRFRDGRSLGELSIFIEDGPTQRKVRRIIEKRVSQNFWSNKRGRRNLEGNAPNRRIREYTSNQLKNIYGSSDFGFVYAA